MKLSIQVQAFLNLMLKFVIALVLVLAGAELVILVPTNLLIGSASVLVMLFCMYNLYQIELMALKSKQDTKFDQK
jgi:hypothetical protein